MSRTLSAPRAAAHFATTLSLFTVAAFGLGGLVALLDTGPSATAVTLLLICAVVTCLLTLQRRSLPQAPTPTTSVLVGIIALGAAPGLALSLVHLATHGDAAPMVGAALLIPVLAAGTVGAYVYQVDRLYPHHPHDPLRGQCNQEESASISHP